VVLDLNRATSGAHARTVSVPPTQAPTVISFTARRKRRARRAAAVAGIAVVTLAAAAVPLLARLGDGRRGGTAGDSASVPVITGATVNPPPGPGVVPPRADSQRPTAVPTRTDSAARAAATLARLAVTAPNDAQIFLNGVVVGEGRWRADTLKPGDYTVAAAIDAPEGCESARQEQEHRLRPGTQREVSLLPRGCGTILLNGQPAGAHYTLVSADGSVKREGNLSEGTLPLLVPIGQYRFSAQKPQCATYDQDAALQVGQTVRIFFKMICVAP
jgi:hypothetical protein